MRRSLYASPIVPIAIGLLGALASAPALAQPTTTLAVSVARAPSELVTAADGGTLDLITYGSTATFMVTVQNIGPSRAVSVSLTGTAPTGPTANPDAGTTTRITAVTPASLCTISGDAASFTCNLPDLPDGQLADGGLLSTTSTGATFRITLALPPRPYGTTCTLPDGGPIAGNSLGPATVTASAANANRVTATVSGTQTRSLADLAVTMTGPDTANEGATVAFQVHASNTGPCAANRVRLTNGNASAGLLFQSNSGACESGYPCTVAASWPAGAAIDVTSTYKVDNLPVGIITTQELNQVDLASTNTANPDGGSIPIIFATPDPAPANNSAATATTVGHGTGCNSVGAGSTLSLFGAALILALVFKRRRRT